MFPPRTRAASAAVIVLLALTLLALPTPATADTNEAPAIPALASIAAGSTHTCVILDDDTVKCLGYGNDGQLGYGDTSDRGDSPSELGDGLPVVNLGTGRTAVALTVGERHSCAILDNGTVKCWGAGNFGKLGYGDTANRGDGSGEMGDNLPAVNLGTGRTAVAISAGLHHTCAILDNGTVKCWGLGAFGRLGQGDTTDRGDQAGEMGNALPAVDLGAGRTALAISGGSYHTCALLDNHAVKCWGYNGFGQLGLGDTFDRGDGPNELGSALPAVTLGTGRTAVAISVGGGHSCAILDNRTLKCWGYNSSGQLGRGNTFNRGDSIGQMGDNLLAVSLGSNRTPIAVSATETHTCAVLDNRTVKCWGSSGSGALGVGPLGALGDEAGEMGDVLPAVDLGSATAAGVTTGNALTCAVLTDGSYRCWGFGGNGRLGTGATDNRGDAVGEMGDNLPPVDLGTGRSIGPAPRVAVTVTADQPSVVAGGIIDYHVTVSNPGRVPLTNVALIAPSVPACSRTIGNLAAGASQVVNCSYATTATDVPQMTNMAFATTGQGVFGFSSLRNTRVDPVTPELDVDLTADQTSVVAGADVDYDLSITNTGNVPLTGVDLVSSLDICSSDIPTLAPAQVFEDSCSKTTSESDLPALVHTATVDSSQTEPVTDSVSVPVHRIRPDALVRLGSGAPVGNGVYNLTGESQARSATVPNRGTATFTVSVQNDGSTADTFSVLGQGTTPRYTVTYKSGTTDVTTQVVDGRYQFTNVPAGATRTLTVLITAKSGTPVGKTLNRLVTVTSTGDPTKQDTVKATVRRR